MKTKDKNSLTLETRFIFQKTLLKGMTLVELKEYFVNNGFPKFRGEQVFNWMYNHLVVNFDEMKNLPKMLREKLSETTSIKTLELAGSENSLSTGTVKFIFRTLDGYFIESVLIPETKRVTLCISTQVGCPLDCKFCATGLMGFKKNLFPGEIFDQYVLVQKNIKEPITNIVYMGMGEPLLNFNATVKTLQIYKEELTTGISLKKITVSTAGIPPKIKELADMEIKVKIALSLHSCFNDIRSKIMPINKKYSLPENIEAINYYHKMTGTRITFEYVMLKGVNDRDEDIKELIKLSRKIPSKINIIPFNSLKHMNPEGFAGKLEPTSKERIEEFVQKLRNNNLTVMVRNTQGSDIAAACGQLAINF